MTTPEIEGQPPCARGCTYPAHEPAAEPTPRPAVHGPLCGRCFYRLTSALEQAPALISNMRSKLAKTGAAQYGERVSGSGGDGSPIPIAIDPLQRSDDLYARLVNWVDAFSADFGLPKPRTSARIDERDVQGMHVVTPAGAFFLTALLVEWLLQVAERIAASAHVFAFFDDICQGWDDEHLGVYSLMARYGVEPPRPRPQAPHECPLCGNGDIFVKWPDKLNPELEVLCARCHHVVDADKVNRHARKTGAIESPKAAWVDELKPIQRRCTGSVDCTAAEHHPRCFSQKPENHQRRDEHGRPVAPLDQPTKETR